MKVIIILAIVTVSSSKPTGFNNAYPAVNQFAQHASALTDVGYGSSATSYEPYLANNINGFDQTAGLNYQFGANYVDGFGASNRYQEPANYHNKYDVEAPEYGVQNGHEEIRRGDVTEGRYYVLLPDGRRQIVEYTADANGYRPRIRYEQANRGYNVYENQNAYPGHSY